MRQLLLNLKYTMLIQIVLLTKYNTTSKYCNRVLLKYLEV